MKIALDTNILVYAEGVNGAPMRDRALDLIERLPEADTVLPVQVLAELYNVLVRKARRQRTRAREIVLAWSDLYPVMETSSAVLAGAADLSAAHELSIWDAVVLSAAAEARCRLLLSEDLQNGFTWRGTTVTNPFGEAVHPLLAGFRRNN